jgi:hypothetical protein
MNLKDGKIHRKRQKISEKQLIASDLTNTIIQNTAQPS